MNEIESVLIRARDILSEYGWTTGVMARDKDGRPTECGSQRAVAFCTLGAISRAVQDLGEPPMSYVVAATMIRDAIGRNVSTWNDSVTEVEVKAKIEGVLATFDTEVQSLELAFAA